MRKHIPIRLPKKSIATSELTFIMIFWNWDASGKTDPPLLCIVMVSWTENPNIWANPRLRSQVVDLFLGWLSSICSVSYLSMIRGSFRHPFGLTCCPLKKNSNETDLTPICFHIPASPDSTVPSPLPWDRWKEGLTEKQSTYSVTCENIFTMLIFHLINCFCFMLIRSILFFQLKFVKCLETLGTIWVFTTQSNTIE